jgi:hypothetical protein
LVDRTTQTIVVGGPYEKPDKPFEIGQLRTKVWRAPFTHGLTDSWRRRCQEYWERVEQRFGVVMSEPRNAWSDEPGIGPVVATYATPLAILKGERMPKKPDARVAGDGTVINV